ncbi:hypothetical protein HH214_09225 [Mucilaginibacter robiniae]|uniref:Uncharacterized protein n=1 Tax=Mucilaginibacter robiniae TaxID=2728022 RepID=A0A7L5E319_9SPHI|nr:hypothetical protein [Mucilaginibacter robiniae]QJD96044.1 hypothetical protein HH214_09225 [Mucilaginibacter robiniae]
MKHEDKFQISVQLPEEKSATALGITHPDETFSFELNGNPVSIINNGDNSWSLVSGAVAQETVNVIGDAIEQYYQDQAL